MQLCAQSCTIHVCKNRLPVHNFINELREDNIYDRMHQPLDTNPNDSYEIFITHFQLAKDKHLPMKSVRYQKENIRSLNG